MLFETLTGRKPFSGETASDTLAEVLKSDLDWSALPAETPASIRKLLRRCLEIYVRPFPGRGGQWQVSNGGGYNPFWSPTGNELYYLDGNKLMSVNYSVDSGSFRSETPRELFGGTFVANPFYRWMSVFPDGEHFLVMQEEGQDQLMFVVNWFDELKRLVPTVSALPPAQGASLTTEAGRRGWL